MSALKRLAPFLVVLLLIAGPIALEVKILWDCGLSYIWLGQNSFWFWLAGGCT